MALPIPPPRGGAVFIRCAATGATQGQHDTVAPAMPRQACTRAVVPVVPCHWLSLWLRRQCDPVLTIRIQTEVRISTSAPPRYEFGVPLAAYGRYRPGN